MRGCKLAGGHVNGELSVKRRGKGIGLGSTPTQRSISNELLLLWKKNYVLENIGITLKIEQKMIVEGL